MIRIWGLILFFLFALTVKGQNNEAMNQVYELGIQSLQAGDYNSADHYFSEYLELAEQHDPDRMVRYLIHLGTLHREALEFETAETYFNKVVIHPKNRSDSIDLVDFYSEKGLLYYDQGIYALSLLELTKSLEIAHQLEDSIGLSIAYINTGNVFKDIQDYSPAEEYYSKALNYSDNTPVFKVKALNNLGATFLEMDDYTKAEAFLSQALKMGVKHNLPDAQADALINLGIIDLKANELGTAKVQFERAATLSDSLNNLDKSLLCAINLYRISYLEGNYNKADSLEQLSLALVDLVSVPSAEVELYEYLSNQYLESNQLKQAYHYQKLLMETKDALFNEEKLIYEKQIKFNLEYNQALSQLEDLETELNTERSAKEEVISRNDELSTQNLWIILLALVTVALLLTILIILIRAYKKKSHYSATLAQRSKELSEKNQEIVNSREYANSMERVLIQQMNPHFIFNCLTTIEASIEIGDVKYAKDYLLLFSSLLRKTLDYSRVRAIPLIDEINFLKDYISFNQFRQGAEFECEFVYDEEEVNDFVNTPSMLIQPFVENAIFHGLYHKTSGDKKLSIKIEPQEHVIVWTIVDNGVGRKKAAEITKQHPGVSHGTKITSDRISWMQNIYQQQLSIVYEDLDYGTKVVIQTPIIEP